MLVAQSGPVMLAHRLGILRAIQLWGQEAHDLPLNIYHRNGAGVTRISSQIDFDEAIGEFADLLGCKRPCQRREPKAPTKSCCLDQDIVPLQGSKLLEFTRSSE